MTIIEVAIVQDHKACVSVCGLLEESTWRLFELQIHVRMGMVEKCNMAMNSYFHLCSNCNHRLLYYYYYY